MTKFTKEQLQQIVETDHVQCGDAAAMARQLLAGLEQEPVAYMYKDRLHTDARFSLHARFGNWSQEDINEYEITEIPLYAAPQLPQPVVGDGRAEFEAWMLKKWGRERHEYDFVMVPTISGQDYGDSYTRCMWKAWSASRATILKQQSSNRASDSAFSGEQIKHPSSNERGRLAFKLRDGWVAVPVDMAPEQMRAVQLNSELGAYAAANLTGAYSLFREFWDVACSAAGNYPATPEGYVLVPIEPTAEMCDVKHVGVDVYTGIAADEYYSIGGEDAAKVWKAMLAAAPKPEVNREMD